MAEKPGVSREEFSVAYNGEVRRKDHTMDVELLAPALLAFGKLLREANTEFNGKRSKAEVLVASDFEQKCFQINFELVVTLYEQLKTILGSEPVKTAKDVLEWVGLTKPANYLLGAPLPYLAYLKWKKGRKVTAAHSIVNLDGAGLVKVNIDGNSESVVVHNHVYNLSQNQKALKATRDALAPIGQDGFDTMEMKKDDKTIAEVQDYEAKDIIDSCNETLAELSKKEPDIDVTTAWLSVYSPVYDTDAKLWRFNLGREHIYADISETTIAEDALARGGAMAEDSYQVRLEIQTPIDNDGVKGKPTYKILEVLYFREADPIARQGRLDLKK